MKAKSVVYLESVSKIYPSAKGEVYAVQDVTIDVQPGEFYSLLGSSGSGKTTTLRMIGGFEIPEYGQVYISGEPVTTLPPYRRNVHTVFQNYALFPHMTVTENIAYPLTIAKLPRAEIAPQVEASLKMFQIQELGDRKPSQLSGGQQQRVALARALISRPKVLLLDEPLSALDAKIREEVRQELRELQRRLNLTFIYVTHDQEEALALSDRIAVMHRGKVEQIGTPKEIYNRPASLFVAQFIGKANFLTGTVQQVDEGMAIVEVNGQLIKASLPRDRFADQNIQLDQTVTLMIRPERIQTHQNASADNRVRGTIESITYIGQSLQIQTKTDLGMLMVTELYSGGDRSDEALTLSWNSENCVVVQKEH